MKQYYYKQAAAISILLLLIVSHTNAQLKGDHILGLAGLQSGTQAPPSIAVFVPVYDYHTSNFKDKDGNSSAGIGSLNMVVTGLGFSYTSNCKILGGNYGATLLLPFASNTIEGGSYYAKASLAFSDIYVQPIQLGWKTPRADFMASYALYIPTGKYTLGGSDNSGLGMWGNEFSGGTTIYLNSKKDWHVAALLSYEINGKKKNAGGEDITVGNLLSIEGGLGKTFYNKVQGTPVPMVINVGMVYYIQYKTSDDKVPVTNTTFNGFLGTHDHMYGLGLEANMLLPKSFTTIGFRWISELGAVNRFQGNTYVLTVAQLLKRLPGKK